LPSLKFFVAFINTIKTVFDTMGAKRKTTETTPVPNPTQLQHVSGSEATTSTSRPAMANDTHRDLWCFIEGDSMPFEVTPLGKDSINELKHLIWREGKNGVLSNTDAKDLVLWKVSSEGLTDSSQLTSYS
jgi:hypothetical protein